MNLPQADVLDAPPLMPDDIAMKWVCFLTILMCSTAIARADLLGDEYRNPAEGIALRPPADCVLSNISVPGQIAEFDDDQRHWVCRVSRLSLPHPLPLDVYKDQFGQQQDGLLNLTVAQLNQQAGTELVMRDLVHVGEHAIPVGILVARCQQNAQRRLVQKALVEANDQLYYLVELNTPARSGADNLTPDPDERAAADTFNSMIDSIELLDRAAIYQDQADRLIRTRGLFANWSGDFLSSKLAPEQYFRLLRDGRDIGYVYETDEYDDKDGRIGDSAVIRISIRSHTEPVEGTAVDSQSRLVVTVDRKHESWISQALVTTQPPANAPAGAKPTVQQIDETGISQQSLRAVPVVPPGGGLDAPQQPDDEIQPGLALRDSWALTVIRRAGSQAPPTFRQDVPPWYLPQALSYLLPRLLPLKEPKTFMFAIYEPTGDNGRQAVMSRYVDVLSPSEVTLDGRQIMAIAIKDRIGLEGTVTTHYFSPDDGSYFGSETIIPGKEASDEPSVQLVLPSDADTLRRLWPSCVLTRPDRIGGDAGQ